jgi:hypothetical protein
MRYAVLLVVVISMAASAQAGPKWELDQDGERWLQMSFLGQGHYSYTPDSDPEFDAYLRRARLILSGQVQDGVRFFVETDNDNAGKAGTGDSSTDIQDAFIDLRLGDSTHWVEAGLILLPFSFENRSSAASLLGLDYNAETIKFVNSFVWRDYGIELYGNFGPRFAYCAGVFDGYDSEDGIKNPEANLRYTGHVAFNLVGEAQSGWFYSQDRKNSESYLSLGVGGNTQEDATLSATSTEARDSDAWVVDVQSGFPVGHAFLTVNGSIFEWDNAAFEGNTAFVETGLQVGSSMATMKYSQQDPDEGEEVEDYTAGVHYFINGHNARAGLEHRWGDSEEKTLLGFQFLL